MPAKSDGTEMVRLGVRISQRDKDSLQAAAEADDRSLMKYVGRVLHTTAEKHRSTKPNRKKVKK